MSYEEDLARKAVGSIVLFMSIKWAAIIIGTKVAKKMLKESK